MPENEIDPQFNYAISQVFSPSLVGKINDPDHEINIKSLLEYCKLYPAREEWNLIKGLDIAYNYLKQYYRCEYVYKNEIVNQVLLKFHNDNSATLLRELASEHSIADIVIINSRNVAYEIKTELDNFDRLNKQLESYEALYEYSYVVTYADAVASISNKIGGSVGIIVLEGNCEMRMVRDAKSCLDKFDPSKAVFTMRQSELMSAYENHVGKLPQMGTALIFDFCHKWYVQLDRQKAHCIFSEALKSRKPPAHQFELIKNCNPALRMLFLGKQLSKKYCVSTLNKFSSFT